MSEEMSLAQAAGREPPPPAVQQRSMLPAVGVGRDLSEILKEADVHVEAMDKITKMALRVTNVNDWVDEGGSPYLEYEGARKIAKVFGVTVCNVILDRQSITDSKGEYIIFTYTGDAIWNGSSTPEIGTCSTRDKFFAERKDRATGNKYVLPLSEVDVTNVMKKAHTNLMNRAIKSKLGLSFTWDEIAEATQGRITREKCSGVAYGPKGSKGGSTSPAAASTTAQNDKRKEVWAWILEFVGGDITLAEDTLENMTKFQNKETKKWVGGRRNIQDVSDAQLTHLHPRVKKEIEAFRASHGPAAGAGDEPPPPTEER